MLCRPQTWEAKKQMANYHSLLQHVVCWISGLIPKEANFSCSVPGQTWRPSWRLASTGVTISCLTHFLRAMPEDTAKVRKRSSGHCPLDVYQKKMITWYHMIIWIDWSWLSNHLATFRSNLGARRLKRKWRHLAQVVRRLQHFTSAEGEGEGVEEPEASVARTREIAWQSLLDLESKTWLIVCVNLFDTNIVLWTSTYFYISVMVPTTWFHACQQTKGHCSRRKTMKKQKSRRRISKK